MNTWEFTSDSIFNELKHKSDRDSTLVPDVNGTWKLHGKRLRITVTGEYRRGEQELFEKPQIAEFEIKKEAAHYIIIIINNGGVSVGKTTKLRLTTKE